MVGGIFAACGILYRALYYFLTQEIAVPAGSGHVSAVPIGAFKMQDIHIVIDAHGDKLWRARCAILERPELADDPRFVNRAGRLQHVDTPIALLQDIFVTRPGADWLARLDAAGVPSGPVNTVDRAVSEPQVLARNMVMDVIHPHYGSIKLTDNPMKISGVKDTTMLAPPTLGEHTVEVLTLWCGVSPT